MSLDITIFEKWSQKNKNISLKTLFLLKSYSCKEKKHIITKVGILGQGIYASEEIIKSQVIIINLNNFND